jgi:hypothetical protein
MNIQELQELQNPARNSDWESFRKETKEQILEWEAMRLALFLEINDPKTETEKIDELEFEFGDLMLNMAVLSYDEMCFLNIL